MKFQINPNPQVLEIEPGAPAKWKKAKSRAPPSQPEDGAPTDLEFKDGSEEDGDPHDERV